MKTVSMILVLLLTNATTFAQTQAEDEAAVRKVIDTETRAYHEANSDLLTAQWSNAPYTERQQQNLMAAVGVPFVKGDKLKAFASSFLKTHRPTGLTVRVNDYNAHISGATAWTTYTEETLDGSGKVVNVQRTVKILEREPDGWKIVLLATQTMK